MVQNNDNEIACKFVFEIEFRVIKLMKTVIILLNFFGPNALSYIFHHYLTIRIHRFILSKIWRYVFDLIAKLFVLTLDI